MRIQPQCFNSTASNDTHNAFLWNVDDQTASASAQRTFWPTSPLTRSKSAWPVLIMIGSAGFLLAFCWGWIDWKCPNCSELRKLQWNWLHCPCYTPAIAQSTSRFSFLESCRSLKRLSVEERRKLCWDDRRLPWRSSWGQQCFQSGCVCGCLWTKNWNISLDLFSLLLCEVFSNTNRI